MKIEETYNIHKKINCMLPFFKSKRLCKKGIHNYKVNHYFEPKYVYIKEPVMGFYTIKAEVGEANKVNLKCLCCGKEIELEE